MTSSANDDLIAALVLLDEPRRRELYDHVIGSDRPVGRDAAAAALGISRQLAAFHLDRLVVGGLLDVEYRRLTGRSGPGAGRPAKLYRRAAREVTASYPPREYVRAAELLAQVVERQGETGRAAAAETARVNGRGVGRAARMGAGPRPGQRRLRTALLDTLSGASFEPQPDPSDGTIRLRNCPYHVLVAGHRELTCGMNLAWAEGLLDGLGETDLVAELVPAPGYCCVAFVPSDALLGGHDEGG